MRYEQSSPRDSLTTVHWTVVALRLETSLAMRSAAPYPVERVGENEGLPELQPRGNSATNAKREVSSRLSPPFEPAG